MERCRNYGTVCSVCNDKIAARCRAYEPFPTRAELMRKMSDEEMAAEIKRLVFELFDDGVPSEGEILRCLQQKVESYEYKDE